MSIVKCPLTIYFLTTFQIFEQLLTNFFIIYFFCGDSETQKGKCKQTLTCLLTLEREKKRVYSL